MCRACTVDKNHERHRTERARNRNRAQAGDPGIELARTVTDLRLAVELARLALRLGRYADARAHLDAVAADPDARAMAR